MFLEENNVFDFLFKDSYQKKIASKSITIGWVWGQYAQPRPDLDKLVRGDFGWSRGCCIVTLKSDSE